eukprot:452668_1
MSTKTDSASDQIINDTLCKRLTPHQPPYAKNWKKFDEIVIELSKQFESSSNPYLHTFAQLHVMARVAMHNRHIGRYEMALALYQHLLKYATSNKITPHEFPRYHALHASNVTVLYRNWASMVVSDNQTRNLRNKSIKQAHLVGRYIEMDKNKTTISSNKLLNIAYMYHYNDSKWNRDVATAKMHTEIGNNLHRLYDDDTNPNKQTVRKAEYHFRKALEIHTAKDFGVDSYYFFDAYINYIYEVRNDLRSNKKLIHKLLTRNLEIATREFGKLSLETICCYRAFARYFAYYLNKHEKAIKYYIQALSQLQLCIDSKTVDNVHLNDQHPHLFTLHYTFTQYQNDTAELYDMMGDWRNALKLYEEVILSADAALQLNPSNQSDLIQLVLKYKQDAKKAMLRIKKYTAFEKEKCECKNCRKLRKKSYKKVSKKWVRGREKCLQTKLLNTDIISLKNIAAAKQCSYCNSKKNNLLKCSKCQKAYYCSKKHQKLHWKIHKKDCC